jgi:hypothetical protein
MPPLSAGTIPMLRKMPHQADRVMTIGGVASKDEIGDCTRTSPIIEFSSLRHAAPGVLAEIFRPLTGQLLGPLLTPRLLTRHEANFSRRVQVRVMNAGVLSVQRRVRQAVDVDHTASAGDEVKREILSSLY